MADWLIEDGIGETRAIRIEGDRIVAAKIAWPGELVAGAVVSAKLASRRSGSARGTARLDDGTEVLVDRLPRDASEGADITLEVTRAAIGEGHRTKRAQARPTSATPSPAPKLAQQLAAAGHSVRTAHRFPVDGWDEICEEAQAGTIDFAGGSLLFSPTPAMTLIDIDGTLRPRALALAAVPAIAEALPRLDIGGSIGIDFPTLNEKADRRAVDTALAEALYRLPHERTAMNGFGFVQIVTRLTGPSIVHRFARDSLGAAARQLLRRAESVGGAGPILMTCHPLVEARISPEWRAELSRRTGREIRVEADPTLDPSGGFAQAVSA
ncbi:ribonuclease [Croceicoccus naphthovorans]|uniref:Ribonuclease n=1 Tax=Croceicoccus naphthovorans TaxID=1348774 RepID=A0A0G3XF22_9SPHN|nr:ribonuclease [Croceicoccus naphthovorans]AKM09199.1 ribonuclease [Croceicoccus naphthovorans]MBB3990421.1 hypothetical protein [Croceicoccus naphthovorans]